MITMRRYDIVAALPKIDGEHGRLVESLVGQERAPLVGVLSLGVVRPQELGRVDEIVEQERAVSAQLSVSA